MDPPSKTEVVVLDQAASVGFRPLPAPASTVGITQVLFYQYVEPMWSKAQLKRTLAHMETLGAELGITGRGRVALEGVNCTLTGPPVACRQYCEGLRAFDARVFAETDFKLTDGVPANKAFKALTLKRTEELVAYGLGGDKAPLLKQSKAKHVEAHEYHRMLEKPNTVVIDVRNYYETDIGRIVPPPGGAEFLDPKMRNSHEFPKWLAQPRTQEQLAGKHVMMYCTGGIRCERASALVHQMQRATEGLQVEGISMVRGGIDRYMKTFPEGGYWQGKNYLFDLRGEQVPDLKPKERLAEEVRSVCCLCSAPFNVYQGKYCCSRKECKVPVIVCHKCCGSGAHKRATLLCPLCKEGHSLRELPLPDLVGQKRRLAVSKSCLDASCKRFASTTAVVSAEPSHRLFVGKLPLTITATSLRHALLGSSPGSLFSADHLSIEWLTDRKTSLFYGSAFVGMPTVESAAAVDARGGGGIGLTVPGSTRRARVAFRPLRDGEEWPREGHVELERPPVPTTPHPHPSRAEALAAK